MCDFLFVAAVFLLENERSFGSLEFQFDSILERCRFTALVRCSSRLCTRVCAYSNALVVCVCVFFVGIIECVCACFVAVFARASRVAKTCATSSPSVCVIGEPSQSSHSRRSRITSHASEIYRARAHSLLFSSARAFFFFFFVRAHEAIVVVVVIKCIYRIYTVMRGY